MMLITRLVLGVLAAAVLVPASAPLDAHFKMLEPASWIAENERGDPQKSAPCGADPKAALSALVSRAVGGSMLHLKVVETI